MEFADSPEIRKKTGQDEGYMKVIKNSDYLYPDADFRANLMGRIKNNFKVLTNAIDDPFQRTLEDFKNF